MRECGKLAESFFDHLQAAFTYTSLGVFIFSGLFLLSLDAAALKNKSLKRELKFTQLTGIAYIVGSIIVFLLLKYIF